jgi:hypothetical protein
VATVRSYSPSRGYTCDERGHEYPGDRLGQGLLVRRVRERPQQRDGDGVELVLGDHPDDLLHGRVGVQFGHHLAAVHGEDRLDRPSGDAPGPAHHRERVTMPGRGDQPDPRTASFQYRVGADGGSVPQTLGPAAQGGQVDADSFGQPAQPGDHSGYGIILGGQHLRGLVGSLPVHQNAVGERATDVHADVVHVTPYGVVRD